MQHEPALRSALLAGNVAGVVRLIFVLSAVLQQNRQFARSKVSGAFDTPFFGTWHRVECARCALFGSFAFSAVCQGSNQIVNLEGCMLPDGLQELLLVGAQRSAERDDFWRIAA